MLILFTNEPKKMALKDIAINSVETTEPVACLFKLKPSSRVPTIKGKRVAGELPITSKATPLIMARLDLSLIFFSL